MGGAASSTSSQASSLDDELEHAVDLASQFIAAHPEKADELFARAKVRATELQAQQDGPATEQKQSTQDSSETISISPDQQVFMDGVLAELNKVRCDPAAYSQWVRGTIVPQFHVDSAEPTLRHMPGDNQPDMITGEGISAVDELIQVLEHTTAMQPLSLSHPLHLAAREHVLDIGPNGVVSHTGTDGSSPTDRTERFGSWLGSVGENISFGHDSPDEVVLQFLIDDNVPGRGHRVAVLNPEFKVVGMWLGTHTKFAHCSTVVFAGGMGPKLIELNEHVHVNTNRADDAQLLTVLGALQQDNPIKKQIEDAVANGEIVDVDYNPGELTLKIANMRYTSKWGVR
jgi:uncharacterized protein YkwD